MAGQHQGIDSSDSGRQIVPLALLFQLLGKLISCISLVPWAWFYARPLQWFMLPHQKVECSTLTVRVGVLLGVLQSFCWWGSKTIGKSCVFKVVDRLTLTSGASLFGWEAHFADQVARGQWTPQELRRNINWLELMAAHLALKAF